MAGESVPLTLTLTLALTLAILAGYVLAADYGIDLCNHDQYHPTPHLNPGDKGTISVDYDSADSPFCDVTLHGCDVCRFVVYVKLLQIPACATYMELNASKALCLPSCSHLLIYDQSYQDVMSEWYFRGNESATYTSLSSQLAFKLCLPQKRTSRGINVRLKFEVQRKEQTFTGAPSEVVTWKTFQSPNFPDGYALRGERFIYSFHNLDPGGAIHVTFDDWDLTPMSRILVYEGRDSNGGASLEFYGSGYRPVVRSTGSDLTLVFQTDVFIEHRLHYMGFRARYLFLADNTSVKLPSTECGGHTRHSVGGVIPIAPMALQDCVWVVSVEMPFQWLELRLNATVVNSTEGDWKLNIKEGLTSSGKSLASISPSQMQSAQFQSLYTRRKGFYVHFTGLLHQRDRMSFIYLSYSNASKNLSCQDSQHALCDRNHCIDRHLVCDGDTHCQDGGDEPATCFYGATRQPATNTSSHSSSNPCNEKQTLCKDGRHCVPLRMLCDNLRDCPDGSDETDCSWKHASADSAEVTNPKPVVCGGEFVACNSGDQCVASWELCDEKFQCLDHSDEAKCDHISNARSSRHSTEISLSIVVPACLVVFLVICFLLALRMRRYSKGCRHRCAGRHRPHRLPLFARQFGIPHGCRSCSVTSSRLLQLSRSTSGASTLMDPLASPPPYDDLLSPSPRSVSEVSATTEFSTLPVIVEPDSSDNSVQSQHKRNSDKPRTRFDFSSINPETGIS